MASLHFFLKGFMFYSNLRETLKSKPQLIPSGENPEKYINDFNKDWYISLFQYSDLHKAILDEKGTLAGIKDTTTDRVYLDFDSNSDLRLAQLDAIEAAHRLVDMYEVSVDSINAYFSGKKGFSLEFTVNDRLTPTQLKTVVLTLGSGLKTLDKGIFDANRIVRIPNTRHAVTGLYKVPLELFELEELTIPQISELAKERRTAIQLRTLPATLKKHLYTVKEVTKAPVKFISTNELDWSQQPKFLSNCRWSLFNGHFKKDAGIRHNAFLCLASTYKNLGFSLDHVYRLMKGVAELQSKVNDCDRYSDEELFNEVVTSVFNDSWQNGQYTCRKDGWLKDYCDALGEHSCVKNLSKASTPHTLSDVTGSFKEYVKNIDKNTVKTGISQLDELVFITTGSNVGLIGAAGSGKSSIALNILNHTSKAGVKSVFASLDMARNRMYEKVMYHLSGLKREQLYELYQTDQEAPLLEKLEEEFGNVFFFNKSCPTVQDVRDYILDCEKESGEKVKLVMLDYFERITSDFSDETQSSKRIAGELQDLVNDLDIALITLVQPNKFALSGGCDSPIYDYTKIKGSSFIYQSFRQIISIWRPGYNPQHFQDDKFMQMAVLKNDLGECGEMAFNWHGPTGKIKDMEPFQEAEFRDFLRQKEEAKNGKKNKNDDGFF